MEIPVGVIYDRISRGDAEFAQRINAFSIHPSVKFASKELVEDAHRRGFKVFCWTLKEGDEIERMCKLGVDGIFVNDPGFAHGVLTEG